MSDLFAKPPAPGRFARSIVLALICWVVTAAAAGAAGGAGAGADWDAMLKAGLKALNENKYADAEKQLLAALKTADVQGSDERRMMSLAALGSCYTQQYKYAQAEPVYVRHL